MALPAQPFLVDMGNGAFMAADTVSLHHLLTVAADLDPLRNPARIKGQGVLHAVDALPDIVHRHVMVGQMAGHAGLPAVRTGMGPGIILRLHHMAAGAELRAFRFRQQPGRPQREKKRDQNAAPEDGENDPPRPPPLHLPH